MSRLKFRLLLIAVSLSLLTACSPHPSSGVWVSKADNSLGLSKMIIAFNGKAEFTTSKPTEAKWHCFWGKQSDKALSLDCTPSTNPDLARKFTVIAVDQMNAEMRENDKVIATLKRVDENPEIAD